MNKRTNFRYRLKKANFLTSLNDPAKEYNFLHPRDLGDSIVEGSFQTSEYLANKGLVTPWLRNRKVDWTNPVEADKYIKKLPSWKEDRIDWIKYNY